MSQLTDDHGENPPIHDPSDPTRKEYPFWAYGMEVHPSSPGTYVYRYIANGSTTWGENNGTDFGEVEGGCSPFGSSKSRRYRFINKGTAAVTLNGKPTATIVNGPGFSVSSLHEGVISPGEMRDFKIEFRPERPGEVVAEIRVPYRITGDATYRFTVRGFAVFGSSSVRGNGFVIVNGEVTPSLHKNTDFGEVQISKNRSCTLEISNSGNGPLFVGKVSIEGAAAADFRCTRQPSGRIDTGRKSEFSIEFVPRQTGIRTAVVTFQLSDLDSGPFRFAIQGTGLPK